MRSVLVPASMPPPNSASSESTPLAITDRSNREAWSEATRRGNKVMPPARLRSHETHSGSHCHETSGSSARV